jgi:hypothetical protein
LEEHPFEVVERQRAIDPFVVAYPVAELAHPFVLASFQVFVVVVVAAAAGLIAAYWAAVAVVDQA